MKARPLLLALSLCATSALPAAAFATDEDAALRAVAQSPLDIFCTERNHNPAKDGPCLHALPGCVRGRWDDYRGVIFGFDTDEGSVSVVALRFVKHEESHALEFRWVRDHETDAQRMLWCRQGEWNEG